LKTPSDVTVVGLGYVGLPLALAFAAEFRTTGFETDESRVEQLRTGNDRNREVDASLITASGVTLTSDESCLAESDFIVVTVPTTVTDEYSPDLSLLESASAMIGRCLRSRSVNSEVPVIVFESTTYPGCTEEFCGPIIERNSGLVSGKGFVLGYSPERTNFGDTEHTLETVVKVVSGQTSDGSNVVGMCIRESPKLAFTLHRISRLQRLLR
jgi:UDP-N-acetyl-D-galactosamine dehydrogenase